MIVKKVKSNPIILVDANTLTKNQYKENVKSYIYYRTGVSEIDVQNYKYNFPEGGKSFQDDNQDPFMIRIDAPSNKDIFVSGDYLMEKAQTLFNNSIEEEIPLKASKPSFSLFDDLNSILEENKEVEETSLKIEEKDDEIIETSSSSVIIKKVSGKLK